MNPDHPALATLHPRSTLAEVDKAYRSLGLPSYWEPKDADFEACFRELNTMEKARAFVEELNADRARRENGNTEYPCQRVAGIEQWLSAEHWQDPKGIAIVFACNRRTHCSCHEVGSYVVRSEIANTPRG